MLGISLNIQETIGHKAREGISYVIHTGWAGSSQILSILRQTRWILVAVIWIYFGVLSSPNPTSLLLDYDLVTCQRARQILGQVSTAVPCMKDGKIDRYFQVKGLIVSDPYKMLNIQCMSSTRMQEKLAHLQRGEWQGAQYQSVDIITTFRTETCCCKPIFALPADSFL